MALSNADKQRAHWQRQANRQEDLERRVVVLEGLVRALDRRVMELENRPEATVVVPAPDLDGLRARVAQVLQKPNQPHRDNTRPVRSALPTTGDWELAP